MEISKSVNDIYDMFASETITIFSTMVKQKRQMNSKALSDMYAESPVISKLVSEITGNGREAAQPDETQELREMARKKDLEIDELAIRHRKKVEALFKVTRTLSILGKSDKNQTINGHIDRLNQYMKSADGFDEELVEQELGELRKEVLKSEGSDRQETGKKKSFLGELFKGGKTVQNEGPDIEKSMKELLVGIVLRLQLEQSDFDQKVKAFADGIKKNDLSDPGAVKAGICELIGNYRERLDEEKASLYELIHEIARKLVDTEKELLNVLSDTQTTAGRSNSDFNDSFTREITGIEEGLLKGNSVDEIRKLVFEKLGNIKTSLQKKRETDSRLFEEVQGHIEHFRVELGSHEQEIRKVQERTDLDALTGIYNKSAFQHRLKEEFSRHTETKSPASLMVFDLDNFKKINEKYSFENGDRILKTIAKAVTDLMPEGFFFARNGGGEFVLLADTAVREAESFAGNLRKTVEGIEFYHKDEKVPVSVSIGVAGFSGLKSPVHVLQKARGALQEAKKKGKNQVCVS